MVLRNAIFGATRRTGRLAARLALAGALAIGVGLMGAPSALAQHVVTDNEAGKLTLDALTATPPVVHHVMAVRYRHAVAARHGRTRSAVQSVAYHRPAHATAHHASSHHRHRT